MGRTLCWYVINKHQEHDHTKQCLNLDCEPYDIPLQDVTCPLCRLYVEGLYDSPLVLDKIRISHSYSNPIWTSLWNVKDLYMGDRHAEFARRFNPDRMYRVIEQEELNNVMLIFDNLGPCFRTVDKEAREETLSILKFCAKWVNNPDVLLVIEDEL